MFVQGLGLDRFQEGNGASSTRRLLSIVFDTDGLAGVGVQLDGELGGVVERRIAGSHAELPKFFLVVVESRLEMGTITAYNLEFVLISDADAGKRRNAYVGGF